MDDDTPERGGGLTPNAGAVTLVCFAFAFPAGVAVAATFEAATGFAALGILAVTVPAVYDRHWPRPYDARRPAATWATAACAVAFAAFLVAYVAAALVVAPKYAAGLAFLLIALGSPAAVGRYGTRLAALAADGRAGTR